VFSYIGQEGDVQHIVRGNVHVLGGGKWLLRVRCSAI
jgi:hypothetical protein